MNTQYSTYILSTTQETSETIMKTRRISRIHEDSREVAKRDTNSSRFSS